MVFLPRPARAEHRHFVVDLAQNRLRTILQAGGIAEHARRVGSRLVFASSRPGPRLFRTETGVSGMLADVAYGRPSKSR
jgi:hypothetical protein